MPYNNDSKKYIKATAVSSIKNIGRQLCARRFPLSLMIQTYKHMHHNFGTIEQRFKNQNTLPLIFNIVVDITIR